MLLNAAREAVRTDLTLCMRGFGAKQQCPASTCKNAVFLPILMVVQLQKLLLGCCSAMCGGYAAEATHTAASDSFHTM